MVQPLWPQPELQPTGKGLAPMAQPGPASLHLPSAAPTTGWPGSATQPQPQPQPLERQVDGGATPASSGHISPSRTPRCWIGE